MGITVTEKQHWKDRIANRIKRRVEEIIAKNDPGFRKRIDELARDKSLAQLGLSELMMTLDQIRNQRKLYKRQHDAQMKQLESNEHAVYLGIGNRICPDEVGEGFTYSLKIDVDMKLQELKRDCVDELMKIDPLGQQISALESEQENLLDTVWLATSPIQIKELWGKMSEMLGQTPSKLQQDALALQPMNSDSK